MHFVDPRNSSQSAYTSSECHGVHNVHVYCVQFFDSGMSLMPSGNGARRIVQLTKAGMFLAPCADHAKSIVQLAGAGKFLVPCANGAKCILQLMEAGTCLVPFAYHIKWISHFALYIWRMVRCTLNHTMRVFT